MKLLKQILKLSWKNKEPRKEISALPDIKVYEFILIKMPYSCARLNKLVTRIKQRPQKQNCTNMEKHLFYKACNINYKIQATQGKGGVKWGEYVVVLMGNRSDDNLKLSWI